MKKQPITIETSWTSSVFRGGQVYGPNSKKVGTDTAMQLYAGEATAFEQQGHLTKKPSQLIPTTDSAGNNLDTFS